MLSSTWEGAELPPTRQTIVITGASSGLGAEMARQFAREGRDLALCARRIERLHSLRAELESAHPQIRVVVRALDVDDHAQVFAAFRSFREQLGLLDRVIVNAGIGKGVPIGCGGFSANCRTANTNFVSALAQCEAAMEIFREQGSGHLVVISSVSALRGFRGAMTTYAASKAAISALAEGIRIDVLDTPISVSTVHPGFIRTEINAAMSNVPFMVTVEAGVRSIIRAIEREKAESFVPAWPWLVFRYLLPCLPLSVLRRLAR